MLQVKRLVACLLAACLIIPCALAADKYAVVETGDYVEYKEYDGRLVYPVRVSLAFSEGKDARLAEVFARVGDEVHVGDPIASFTVFFDEEAYASAQRALERKRQEALLEYALFLRTLAEMTERLSRTYRAADKADLTYAIRVKKMEFRRYVQYIRADILTREDEIREMEETREPVILSATIDGVVSYMTGHKVGDSVARQEIIAELYDPASRILLVNDSKNEMRYNMEVEVTLYDSHNSVTTTGRVVSSLDVLPDRIGNASVYVVFDEPEGSYPTQYVRVRFEAVRADGVLLVPYDAVGMENGLYYAFILAQDGTRQKRYINLAGHADGVAWLLQGLSEGDTILY